MSSCCISRGFFKLGSVCVCKASFFPLSGQMSSLEQDGEEVVGQARCPFESRQSNVGLFAGELAEHQPSGEEDTKSPIISLAFHWHFTKRRKSQWDSSDHRSTEIQKGHEGDETCLSFFLFVPYTHWTELSWAPLHGVCVVLIYQYLFLTSLPRRWLLFSHNDRFSSKWCSDLPKFRRKQSCPAYRKIRLKMAARWVICPMPKPFCTS